MTRRPRDSPLRSRAATAWLRAAVAVAALGAASVADPAEGDARRTPETVAGTYRLHGVARVALGPILDREVTLHADARLARGDGAREVRVHVAAEGYGCELVARLDPAGALTFADGQRCTVTITAPDTRGRLQGTLRAGHGHVEAGRLALELSGDVDGSVSRRTGGMRVLGQELPATWTPEIPVRGSVQSNAEGDLDRSRAAQP